MNNKADFIDRHSELASLQGHYDVAGSQLVVVYGRRRLGKTALIRAFTKDKPCVYYMADRAGEVSQRNAVARVMADALGEPSLASARYDDWYALFQTFDRFRKTARKTVLVLDEYQYLCQVQSGFSSFLQKWWDENWSRDNLFLILCGSLTSMMYRETLANSSPLYGRSDAQILLKPLDYMHVRDFCSDKREVALVERFALCGGVPRYLQLLKPYRTFREALVKGVLDTSSVLYAEARYLLRDEIDVPNTCWSVLEAIAGGAHRISEIAARLATPANQLTRYLDLLRDLAIVEREVPVTEKNPSKSKRGIYNITDPFLGLWFGCVYPYESFFEFGHTDAALRKLRPRLDRHIEACYEHLCRARMRHTMDEYGCVKVGRAWSSAYEIDIAGVDERGLVRLCGECKWSRRKVGVSILNDLRATMEASRLPVAADAHTVLFGRSGFTQALRNEAEADKRLHLVDRAFVR